MFRRYRITPRKDLHRAAEKMNEFFQQETSALEAQKKVSTMENAKKSEGFVN